MREKILTLSEVKRLLEDSEKKRNGLQFNEQKWALQHLKDFARISESSARKLIKELKENEKITDVIAVKIADILPQHEDDVRAIFAKEVVTIEKKEIEEIIKKVKNYL